MITIFITGNGSEELLTYSMEAVLQQSDAMKKKLQIVVLAQEKCADIERRVLSKYDKNNVKLLVYKENPGKAILSELRSSPTRFLSIIRAGEAYILDGLEKSCIYLEENTGQTDAAVMRNIRKKEKIPKSANDPAEGEVFSLTDKEVVMKLPGCLRGIVLAADAVLDSKAYLSLEDGGFEAFIYCILERKKTLAYMKNAFFSGKTPISDTDEIYSEWTNKDWYLDTVNNYCLKLLEKYRGHELESFVQAQVLFVLKIQFQLNLNSKNKGVLSGEERAIYLDACRQCLKSVSNDYIFATGKVQLERKMNFALKSAFLRLKYEGAEHTFYIKKGEKPQIFCEDETINQDNGLEPFVTLELMEFDENLLKLDVSIDRFVTDGSVDLNVISAGETVEVKRVNRFAQKSYFGQAITEKAAYCVIIPKKILKKKQLVEFLLVDKKNNQLVLPIITADYQAKLTRLLKNSYWTFDQYKVTLRRGDEAFPSGLIITRSGKPANIVQELKLLKEMVTASYGSKRMFAMRCLYWATYPVYSRKNIWITFDKLYKGGDCGEYFFKYMCTRKEDGITPVYIIRADVPDCSRLQKAGYQPLYYHSLKQRLMYLHAKMIFATHSSVHSFCGFSKWEVRFIQDRIKSVNTCIQHGLSVQDLTFDSNRIVNNNKRYYCASRYEVENLSKPAYDYGPDVLRLTGIPRYDGLINRDKKQILITPTWRAYIAMPAVMGEARPYNPEFKNTDYYKIFQSLLENKRLSDMAAKTGYKIIYLLHPVISSQKDDFRPANDIEIVSAVDVNYEKILTESSLMVTDYSGVQFDFAYMRKPVVYFHPPKLPPHYEEGGFFYDTQGFGEICKETEELVDVLCSYMENGCQLKDFYRARQDDFFAFDDLESCKRIYEDALQYQKEHTGE